MSFLKSFFRREFEAKGLDMTNEPFIQALEIALYTNKSLFLTGKAGTGKTTFLHTLRKFNTTKSMVVVAPTGVAAINAKGKTIHSFLKLTLDRYFSRVIIGYLPKVPSKIFSTHSNIPRVVCL